MVILVVAVDPFLSILSNLIECSKNMGIEYFMTVGEVKAFNKAILLGLTGQDKMSSMPFDSHQLVKIVERSSLPLSRLMAFGKPTISSNFSMTRTTRAVDKLRLTSIASTSRLDSSITFKVLKGLP